MADHVCTTPQQTKSSRRVILGGLVAAPVAFTPVMPVVALAASSSVHELWNERRGLCALIRSLNSQAQEATALMPWWAQPGPMYLYHDGSFGGEVVFSPAMQGVEPPRHGAFKNIRPGSNDLRRDYELYLNLWGTVRAEEIKRNYRDRLRALAQRRREQRREKEKVGLIELQARLQDADNRAYDLGEAIEDFADHSPDVLAAKLMVGLGFTAHADAHAGGHNLIGIKSTLEALLPHLAGNIAADVADLLDHPCTPLCERAAWLPMIA